MSQSSSNQATTQKTYSSQFAMVPLALVGKKNFNVSILAAIIFGLFRSRNLLSQIDNFRDPNGRICITYKIKDLMDDLGLCNNTVIAAIQELIDAGLVEKKRAGLTQPNYYYINDPFTDATLFS